MNEQPIDITLSVETKEELLIAHLLFFNGSSQNFYLDRFSICHDGHFTRHMFKITDENENTLPYIGFMVKRLVKAEHFIALESGAAIKTSIALNNGYPLQKGKRYFIQYTVFNPGYLKEQSLTLIQSNEVEVNYV